MSANRDDELSVYTEPESLEEDDDANTTEQQLFGDDHVTQSPTLPSSCPKAPLEEDGAALNYACYDGDGSNATPTICTKDTWIYYKASGGGGAAYKINAIEDGKGAGRVFDCNKPVMFDTDDDIKKLSNPNTWRDPTKIKTSNIVVVKGKTEDGERLSTRKEGGPFLWYVRAVAKTDATGHDKDLLRHIPHKVCKSLIDHFMRNGSSAEADIEFVEQYPVHNANKKEALPEINNWEKDDSFQSKVLGFKKARVTSNKRRKVDETDPNEMQPQNSPKVAKRAENGHKLKATGSSMRQTTMLPMQPPPGPESTKHSRAASPAKAHARPSEPPPASAQIQPSQPEPELAAGEVEPEPPKVIRTTIVEVTDPDKCTLLWRGNALHIFDTA